MSRNTIDLFRRHIARTQPPPSEGDLELQSLKAARDRMVERASRLLARADSLNTVIQKLEGE